MPPALGCVDTPAAMHPSSNAQRPRPRAAAGRRALHLPAALAAACLAGVGLTGCTEVRFYEKQAFSQRVMDLADDRTHTHFQQKVFYSIEGAAGGLGTGAGGGCGCY